MLINDKYVKQTMDALADNRLNVPFVARQVAQFPVREQLRFFHLAISYIEAMAQYNERGYTLMGLEQVVKACGELMEIVKLHFPKEDIQPTLPGMEYVQI
jgi:predicted metalloenzyme YecM